MAQTLQSLSRLSFFDLSNAFEFSNDLKLLSNFCVAYLYARVQCSLFHVEMHLMQERFGYLDIFFDS